MRLPSCSAPRLPTGPSTATGRTHARPCRGAGGSDPRPPGRRRGCPTPSPWSRPGRGRPSQGPRERDGASDVGCTPASPPLLAIALAPSGVSVWGSAGAGRGHRSGMSGAPGKTGHRPSPRRVYSSPKTLRAPFRPSPGLRSTGDLFEASRSEVLTLLGIYRDGRSVGQWTNRTPRAPPTRAQLPAAARSLPAPGRPQAPTPHPRRGEVRDGPGFGSGVDRPHAREGRRKGRSGPGPPTTLRQARAPGSPRRPSRRGAGARPAPACTPEARPTLTTP